MDLLPVLYWVVLLMMFAVGAWATYSNGAKAYGPAMLLTLIFVFIGIRLFPVSFH